MILRLLLYKDLLFPLLGYSFSAVDNQTLKQMISLRNQLHRCDQQQNELCCFFSRNNHTFTSRRTFKIFTSLS